VKFALTTHAAVLSAMTEISASIVWRSDAEASRMIGKIRDLRGHLGEVDEFASYLTKLRIQHKPKRNLMKLLEKVK